MAEPAPAPAPTLGEAQSAEVIPFSEFKPVPAVKPLAPGKAPAVPVIPGVGPKTNNEEEEKKCPYPTGLSKESPIEMKWFKKEEDYPSPIFLTAVRTKSLKGVKPTLKYWRNEQKALPPPYEFIKIGVPLEYWPRVGKILQLMSLEPRCSKKTKNFRDLLKEFGFNWRGLEVDHVQDIFWDGPDAWDDFWPIDQKANRSTGPSQNRH